MDKRKQRIRRATRARSKIRQLGNVRLCIYRSLNNIYAQLISPCGSKVLAAASTLEKEVRSAGKHGGNAEAATKVGQLIAKRGLEVGVNVVAFDRSGYKYHGRVSALAKAAREGGLEF